MNAFLYAFCLFTSSLSAQSYTADSPLAFASYYGSNMVLQKAPKQAKVWGVGTVGNKLTLTMTPAGSGQVKNASTIVKTGYYPTFANVTGVWSFLLEATPAGGPYTLKVKDAKTGEKISIDNVMFGDVWICSGQSNMYFPMSHLNNATAEIASADNYPDIRVFIPSEVVGKVPYFDLISIQEKWSESSKSSVTQFSAVCWLYARHIYHVLKYPIGLVEPVWGGTLVEVWSSPDSLAVCDLGKLNHVKASHYQSNNLKFYNVEGVPTGHSLLWNSMIHPFLNMTIYGVLWYQGEANTDNPDTYNCSFPAMINDWRKKFHDGSDGQTSSMFPFGFVQLGPDDSPTQAGSNASGYPDVRWHQTADVGYVPNARMKNVFMSVAVDIADYGSPYGPVHTRDKQDVALRLALAGMAVAYNMKTKYQGPFPKSFSINPLNVTIVYESWTTNIEVRNKFGFELCCTSKKQTYCAPDDRNWSSCPVGGTSGNTVTLMLSFACIGKQVSGIRYEWRQSPCQLKQCGIYDAETQLPAAPFLFFEIDK